MMASNMVPPMLALKLDENVPERAAGMLHKSNIPGYPPENDDNRLKKVFDNLVLRGADLWTVS